jgi:hypothetical protein
MVRREHKQRPAYASAHAEKAQEWQPLSAVPVVKLMEEMS